MHSPVHENGDKVECGKSAENWRQLVESSFMHCSRPASVGRVCKRQYTNDQCNKVLLILELTMTERGILKIERLFHVTLC